MQTVEVTLSSTWQQIADASGTVTAQLRSVGWCDLYVGSDEPTSTSPSLRVPGDGMQLSSSVLAWVRGAGVLGVITV